jgi:hypothetical protein
MRSISLPIGIVAPASIHKISRLERRHQQLDGPCPICSSRTIATDLASTVQAQRQPGIDASRFLADHAGAQHQPVRNDLCFAWAFLSDVGRK